MRVLRRLQLSVSLVQPVIFAVYPFQNVLLQKVWNRIESIVVSISHVFGMQKFLILERIVALDFFRCTVAECRCILLILDAL